MFDDLTREIKAQLYERVQSPLFGAFAFSWAAWNYRALLGVISELSFNERMAYLDALYPTWQVWGWHCFIGPLLTALAFLLAYPWPARWMYSYWAWQQKKLKTVQQRIEDETPLTQEEAKALRKISLEQVTALEEKILGQQQLNNELNERLRVAAVETERLTKERDLFLDQAKKSQEELKQHIQVSSQGLPQDTGKTFAETLRGGGQVVLGKPNSDTGTPLSPLKYQPTGYPLPTSYSEFMKASGRNEEGKQHLSAKVFTALCKLDGGTTREIATVAETEISKTLETLLELAKDGRAVRVGDSWNIGPIGKAGLQAAGRMS